MTKEARWQALTATLLIVGYSGYYACRSNLSVCRPQILEEFAAQGIDKAAIGTITFWGTLAYACGKLIWGPITDALGGRSMFLSGMVGAIFFTLMFAFGPAPGIFLVAWVGNRLVQSMGWGGMVNLASKWYLPKQYGTMMGFISLSYLFGDWASRLILGKLIEAGWGWRHVYVAGAGFLAMIFVCCLALLKQRPSKVGLPEIVPQETEQEPLKSALRSLTSSPAFWVTCALSFVFTFVRETFNDWTPTFLVEVAKLAKDRAAIVSSSFPLFGGFSVLLVGYLADRVPKGGKSLLIGFGLAVAIPMFFLLGSVSSSSGETYLIGLLGATAVLILGPYSLFAGAMALHYGNKRTAAAAAGLIDGIGYFGGMISAKLVGDVATKSGWTSAWHILGWLAALGVCIAIPAWMLERRAR